MLVLLCKFVLSLSLLLMTDAFASESTAQKQNKTIVDHIDPPWYIRRYHHLTPKPWVLKEAFDNTMNKHAHHEEHSGHVGEHSHHGMYELTQFPNMKASVTQQKVADEFIAKTLQASVNNGWLDIKKAREDGFSEMYGDRIHFVNKRFLYDTDLITPERPEFLMFYQTQYGPMLMGVMYVAETKGPQIGGPLTLWHYHIERDICYERGILPIGQYDKNGHCAKGISRDKSPEMMHVWFFNHPEGRFATRMRLTEEQFEQAVKEVLEIYKKQGAL